MGEDAGSAMEMPAYLDLVGRIVERTAGLWLKLGNLETRLHQEELAEITIDRPIYVAGLARAGSTILLELLAGLPEVATHRYRDFPPIQTPIFWNRASAHLQPAEVTPVERAHQDRILVTPDSPEAMEEVLWMAFFPDCHDPSRSNLLDAATSEPAFERFYRDHLAKILLLRGGRRYLSKGNYNVARLAYLLKLFPEARFVLPVRDPVWHVASLLKQHRLFCAAETRDPRILGHLRRVGHFEFGLDRRMINLGDDGTASVGALWAAGEEVRGWARCWNGIYSFLLDQLDADGGLRARALMVRYEDLCDQPRPTLERILRHVELDVPADRLADMAARLSRPHYYRPDFDQSAQVIIAEETASARRRLGY